MLGLVLALALVGLGLSLLAGPTAGRSGTGGTSQAATQPGAGSSAGGSVGGSGGATLTALPPVAELTPSALPPEQAPAQALQVASRWATAWATHPAGTTTESWLAGLRPYTTDEYLTVLTGVDPGNVPATRVTGPAKAVRYSPHSVQVDVPTDALTLRILVIDGDSGWRVAGHDRAGQ